MLSQKKYWIFDLDGTLTVANHDFDEIRKKTGMSQGKPILETLAKMPKEEAKKTYEKLDAIEYDIALTSKSQEYAHELLTYLKSKGVKMGILTRNSFKNAIATLKCCDLYQYFEEVDILGRDNCKIKPDPEGIMLLLKKWNGTNDLAVMMGDFLFDLNAGKNAGVDTIYIDVNRKFKWSEFADVKVAGLKELNNILLDSTF